MSFISFLFLFLRIVTISNLKIKINLVHFQKHYFHEILFHDSTLFKYVSTYVCNLTCSNSFQCQSIFLSLLYVAFVFNLYGYENYHFREIQTDFTMLLSSKVLFLMKSVIISYTLYANIR